MINVYKTKHINNRSEKSNNVAGVPIVLTASRAEMSHYNYDPFIAFQATFPHKLFPEFILKKRLQPINNSDDSAKFAPYGLRKVETMLIDEFGEQNVVTSHYDNLDKFVGANTKLVCVTTMDPMGLAYVSTTYNSLVGFGGEALNASEFRKLMYHPSIRMYKPKILAGGAGVWQIKDANMQDEFGINVLFLGEGERELIPTVKRLLNGEDVPKYVTATKPSRGEVPLIKYAATYGSVEITRGCGRGCHFCSATMRTKYSFSLEHIMKEVKINVEQGSKMIFTTTEDMFLYKSHPGFKPNRAEVVKLYDAIAKYPGVEWINLSHASLAPIIYDPKILEELSPILLEKTRWTPEYKRAYKKPFITVEVGIETGSVRLMQKHMKGKALPYTVDNWPELVVQAIGIMNDYDWWPLCTIMTGMPDEGEDDVLATLELVDDLKAANAKMFYTPILFIPLEEALLRKAKRADLKHFDDLQWDFIARCWQNNIDFWAPDKKLLIAPITFLSHLLWLRWRHGKKATIPMMKIAGFPDSFFKRHVNKECTPEYCYSKRLLNFEKLGDTISIVKNGLGFRGKT